MNTVEKIFHDTKDVKLFAKAYIDHLYDLLVKLDFNSLAAFADELESARQQGNTVFCVGNGGSAGTASHMANDFGGDIRKKSGTEKPFRVLSLTDNIPLTMAIANDDGYENIFINQLLIHYRQGDKLVAISASGNSPNVVRAAEWVKQHGGTVISLVGFEGGKLAEQSDVTIHVKTLKGEYGPVEDIHVIMNHLLANWFQYKLSNDKGYNE